MAIPVAISREAEHQRQQLVAELLAEEGPAPAEQNKPGSLGCHELLDRTALAADLVERYISTHPACLQNPEWYALAERAAGALRELYQRVGAEHLEANGTPDATH